MSYADLGTRLFLLWWAGCWIAYWMSIRSNANRDTRMISLVFGITIATFYACFHGKASVWHFWWYAWNSLPNATLFLVAWYAPEARARLPLIVLSLFGIGVDATFFGFAASGNRLPGDVYFVLAATVESLQVLYMVYFSGPVEPAIKRALTFIRTRKYPWTNQQRLLHRV